jgi:uncharacterized membrane protein
MTPRVSADRDSARLRTAPPIPDEPLTLGQRVADHVAAFGGSWPFIALFLLVMIIWIALNLRSDQPVDPYPFILLNLLLSCLAALQAPIIMMSQNRQAARDRAEARRDYEVNRIAEEQVLEVHRKLDELRATQVAELLELQRRQMEILELLGRKTRDEMTG